MYEKAAQMEGDGTARQHLKFVQLHRTQHTPTKTSKEMVINLSDQKLDDKMYSLLKGLNFAVTPRTTPIENILAGVGEAVQSLSVERAEKARPKL
jgi:hypothetical protein